MKTVLVTGSNGFIGSHLVERLERDGVEVIPFNLPYGDVRRKIDLDEDIDLIFHLAALLKESNFSGLYETNVIGTRNVVDLALRKNAKLIFSSTYVYGNPDKLPVDEVAELRPHTPYTKSKVEAEKIIQKSKLDYVILRQINIYGLGQKENMLIPFIIKQVKGENNEISLFGSSESKRDFLYIDDLIEVMLLAANYLDKGSGIREIFNIGSSRSYSVGEIVELIQKIAGTRKKVCYGTMGDGVSDCYADITKAIRVLGWQPQIDIVGGLKRMISSY